MRAIVAHANDAPATTVLPLAGGWDRMAACAEWRATGGYTEE